jgi:uncharacterized tellurite resistance protein B-like protein
VNAARLTRRWQEAAGDPALMAEALVDEINDPATGLVTRDFLRAELNGLRQEMAQLDGRMTSALAQLDGKMTSGLAQLDGKMTSGLAQLDGKMTSDLAQLDGKMTSGLAQLESRLIWRIVTLLGVQIALVGILVTVLVQVLR